MEIIVQSLMKSWPVLNLHNLQSKGSSLMQKYQGPKENWVSSIPKPENEHPVPYPWAKGPEITVKRNISLSVAMKLHVENSKTRLTT